MKKSLLAGLIVLLLIIIVAGASTIRAATADVTGYAWSSNIGWIQFETGVGSPPGVTIETTTGNWDGYAWSSNIGWIDFDDNACGSGAHVDLISGAVTGWAEVLSADGNGWDGCIELSGTNHTSPDLSGNGGVTYNPTDGSFVGFAWGGPVVGWVQFNSLGGGPDSDPGDSTCTDCGGGGFVPVVTGSCAVISPVAYTNIAPSTPVTYRATASNGTSPYAYSWNGMATSSGPTPNEYTTSYVTTPPAPAYVHIGDSDAPVKGYSGQITCPTVTILPPVTSANVRIGRTVVSAVGQSLIINQGDKFAIVWMATATEDHTATVSISPASANPGLAGWTSALVNGSGTNNGDGTVTWNGNTGTSLSAGTTASVLAPGVYQFTITFDNGDGSPQTATVSLRVVQTTETEI